jgi:membrane protease YdiL (CAAX protease family)
MNGRPASSRRCFPLHVVIFGSLGMAIAWLLTPSYGPWLSNAAVTVPILIAAIVWGETARNLQLTLRAATSSAAVGLTLALVSWLLVPPLAREFPYLGTELKSLYLILNRPPGPIKALPILLLTAAAEELVWRGELVSWLERRYGLATTVVISTISYSLPIAASKSLLLFCVATGLGSILALQRIATRSWVAPLISHAIWSLGVFVIRPIG